MSNCKFSISFDGETPELIARITSAINGAGGSFEGSTSAGRFSTPTPLGEITGNYNIMENSSTINITIAKKPLLVSCRVIEGKMNAYLAG